MTPTPNTAALRDLLERVEAGGYDRPDGRAKRYVDFSNDLIEAGVGKAEFSELLSALKEGTAQRMLRALLATDTEGR